MEAFPGVFTLDQNWPNPFNSSTVSRYRLNEAAHISLVIYNTLGEQVIVLENGYKTPGNYLVAWDGKNRYGDDMPSGVYWLCLCSGHIRMQKAMVLVR